MRIWSGRRSLLTAIRFFTTRIFITLLCQVERFYVILHFNVNLRVVSAFIAANSSFAHATSAEALIIIALDIVQMYFGPATDQSSLQATHLTALVQYVGEFGPSTIETDGEASHPGPRMRKRGPRSQAASALRLDRRSRRADVANSNETTEERHTWQDMKFRVLHVNIRGWVSHVAELAARLRRMKEKPNLICVNETFLDRTLEHLTLEGYTLVARRDRNDGRQGGGIAALAASDIAERVTLIQSSDDAERFWLMVHADQGPHLVGVWYRPPAPGETGTVTTFKSEYSALENTCLGSIILGDLNVHNRQWLKHSSHNSAEGRALQDACDDIGLRQIVTKPTREDHLLDLVLTNISGARTNVLPCIADHKLVVTELPFNVPEQAIISRTVWRYAKADWERLRSELEETDWNCMTAMDPDAASMYLANRISDAAELCVPKKQIREKKSTHPWLTSEIEDRAEAKRAAEGTPKEREAAEACSAGILKQYVEFTKDSARKLSEMPAGSKGWWSKTRRLMDNKPAVSSVPALKTSGGEWIFEPMKKATVFSKTFSDKYSLAPKEENEYSVISVSEDQLTCGPLPAEEDAAKTLGALKIDSATGPDLLPVRILKECAVQLAKPFRLLATLILQYKTWPRPWMEHWIVPLYKKGASFVPGNYRGIHLTPQISKAMERFIGSMFTTIISLPACVGPNQFAYQKARGARDALAFMVLTWISGFNAKVKFAL